MMADYQFSVMMTNVAHDARGNPRCRPEFVWRHSTTRICYMQRLSWAAFAIML